MKIKKPIVPMFHQKLIADRSWQIRKMSYEKQKQIEAEQPTMEYPGYCWKL